MAPKEAPKGKGKGENKAKADTKAKPAPRPKRERKPEAEEDEEAPRTEAPDYDAHQTAVAKIQEEIDKLQKETFRLRGQLNERSHGKEDFLAKKAAIQRELKAVSQQINEIQEQKDQIHLQIAERKEENQAAKDDLKTLKKSMNFKSEADIDHRIAQIELNMWSKSLSLKDEKWYMQEIKELNKNRPKVSQLSEMQARIENFDSGGFREQMKELSAQMYSCREQKKEIVGRMAEVAESRKAQMGDYGEVTKQLELIMRKVNAKSAERDSLMDDFNWQKWEYQTYLAEQRRKQQDKYAEERRAQQEQWKIKQMERQVEKLDEQPHTNVITLIEQTIKFCQDLLPHDLQETQEEKKETIHNNKDNEVVLLKKEDRDSEMFCVPTKKGKAAKKGKAPETDASKKPIKHNATTFKLFDSLKLDAPITVADIPALLEKLNKQMAVYQAKVKNWQENKEELKRKILEGISTCEEEAATGREKKGSKLEADVEEEEKEEQKEEDRVEERGKESGKKKSWKVKAQVNDEEQQVEKENKSK